MREINVNTIISAVEKLAIKSNYTLNNDLIDKINEAEKKEEFPVAKNILCNIKENIEIASGNIFPLCQDTGMACVYCNVGQDVHIVGGLLEDAINEGVRRGYSNGFLRKSVVKDPLNRINTEDNTPAHIIYKIVEGDKIEIKFAPKGFGSENMSKVKMLTPAEGVEGVKKFVIDTVISAGANPCPPIVVGVGIGGTFDKCAMMAKEALLIPLSKKNDNDFYDDLEKELLEKINNIGIGPQGFGGETTALAVKIKTYPTHIAGLPVAVNINCHVARHEETVI